MASKRKAVYQFRSKTSTLTEPEMALAGPTWEWTEEDFAVLKDTPFKTAFIAEHRAWIEAGKPDPDAWRRHVEESQAEELRLMREGGDPANIG